MPLEPSTINYTNFYWIQFITYSQICIQAQQQSTGNIQDLV